MKERARSFLADPSGVRKEESKLWNRLESSPLFASASTILLYMALSDEVQTAEFVDKWSGAKRIVLPLVEGESLVLKEYAPGMLHPGYAGIMEPSPDAVTVAPSEVDLAIVPGQAFTVDGRRLGRGKGFYDRLLPELKCPKIGICHSFRIVDDLPCDEQDCILDAIL